MSVMVVAPLPDASAKDLNVLFREEAWQWKKQLGWNYAPTLELVRELVVSRSLPGYVLRHGKQTVGYSYYVFDRPVGFIGGLYILNSFAHERNYQQLIEKLVVTMQNLPELDRIESQVMPFNTEFAGIFSALEFKVLPRYFLSAALDSGGYLNRVRPQERSDEFRIVGWQPEFVAAAAEVIYDSYLESADTILCRDYQTRKGCMRFLRNVTQSPACGKFSQGNTRAALDQDGRLCGVLLATEIDHDMGMIPQLSVRRDYQGQGIGSQLLVDYMKAARERGLLRVSLSVSQANRRAFDLYQRFGFETGKRFHALIWDRCEG